MKLSEAFLCLDCDEVYHRVQGDQMCPGCGSRFAHPIAHFIKEKKVCKCENSCADVVRICKNCGGKVE